MSRIPVGILGATGAVGQKFVELLDGHPWFEVVELAASDRSAGKAYRECVNWIGDTPMPDWVGDIVVKPTAPELNCRLVFSALPSAEARDTEVAFAEAGYAVVSNAASHRMGSVVPLLIPEVNAGHLELIKRQPTFERGGFIVTNPNCSTTGLVAALKPLFDSFGLQRVQVTTLQALSGAGYPGVASLDAVANVVPFISNEEDKLEIEPSKLLGRLSDDGIVPAEVMVSAQCNRVPVVDGHMLCVSVAFERSASPREVEDAINGFEPPVEIKRLPSGHEAFLQVLSDAASPQPRRHVQAGKGMTVSVGRVQDCPVNDVKFVALVHNTVRGAAGGAILNAELLADLGYVGVERGVLSEIDQV